MPIQYTPAHDPPAMPKRPYPYIRMVYKDVQKLLAAYDHGRPWQRGRGKVLLAALTRLSEIDGALYALEDQADERARPAGADALRRALASYRTAHSAAVEQTENNDRREALSLAYYELRQVLREARSLGLDRVFPYPDDGYPATRR